MAIDQTTTGTRTSTTDTPKHGSIVTARDRRTGRTVEFRWYGDTEPADTDLDEIFAATGLQPSTGPVEKADDRTLAQRVRSEHPTATTGPPGMSSSTAPDEELQAIVQRMVEAGESEADIALVIRHYQPLAVPSSPDGTAPAAPAGPMHPHARTAQRVGQAARWALDPENLPTTMGAVFGLASGGLGLLPAAGMAALGGAGGAGYRQAARALQGRIRQVPETIPGQLAEMAGEGAGQAVAEAGGRGVAAGAKLLGRGLFGSAVPTSAPVRRQFPTVDVTETGLREGIPVGRAAADLAARRVADSRAMAGRMLQERMARDPGLRVGRDDLARGLDRTLSRIARQPANLTELDELARFEREFAQSHPERLTLDQVQGLKESGQEIADKAYRAVDRHDRPSSTYLSANMDVAREARQILGQLIPGLGPQNRRTQELSALTRALREAEHRRPGIGLLDVAAGMGVGTGTGDPLTGLLTGLGTRIARDPRVASRLGIGLYHTPPAVPANTLRAALLSLFGDGSTADPNAATAGR